MCQKATGGFFGPFVDAGSVSWTRGAPTYFQSSNRVRRGFCNRCGTALTFEREGWPINLAIGVFDEATDIAPTVQVGVGDRLPYVQELPDLPVRPTPHWDKIVSFQHPDHDTPDWPLT
jgi:hypothetical protein